MMLTLAALAAVAAGCGSATAVPPVAGTTTAAPPAPPRHPDAAVRHELLAWQRLSEDYQGQYPVWKTYAAKMKLKGVTVSPVRRLTDARDPFVVYDIPAPSKNWPQMRFVTSSTGHVAGLVGDDLDLPSERLRMFSSLRAMKVAEFGKMWDENARSDAEVAYDIALHLARLDTTCQWCFATPASALAYQVAKHASFISRVVVVTSPAAVKKPGVVYVNSAKSNANQVVFYSRSKTGKLYEVIGTAYGEKTY